MILSVGAYTLDLYMIGGRLPQVGESVSFRKYAEAHGGKAVNQAVAAARMGVQTGLAVALGDDAAGQSALEMLRQEGILCSYSRVVEQQPTARSFILLDDAGMQLIATVLGAAEYLEPSLVEAAVGSLEVGSLVLLQGETSLEVIRAVMRAKPPGVRLVVNPSPVERFEEVTWDKVDFLVLNQTEAHWLAGDGADARRVSQKTAVAQVVVTLGADGAEVWETGYTYPLRHPAPRVEVVDSTGAGDGFLGALAAQLHDGVSLSEAVRLAVWVGSYSTTRRFCVPSYPTRPELERFVDALNALNPAEAH